MGRRSSWSEVIIYLQKEGYNVIAPQFPLTSHDDNVDRLHEVLDLETDPTFIAGYSYDGQIMTALGTNVPNVMGLVYVAAFALDDGETLGELLSQEPPTPALAHINMDNCGFAWLSQSNFVNHFAADVDPVKANTMYAVQQPVSGSAFGDKMGTPAWKTVPSWYLVTTNDESIPPDAQRMGANTSFIASSHVPMVSHPEEVAQLIMNTAKAASKWAEIT